MASNTRSLTEFYGVFFLNTIDIAFSPYTKTLEFVAGPDPEAEDVFLAIGTCLVLTFAVPILPTLFSITFAIASIMATLAMASMFITYLLALIIDCCEAVSETGSDSEYRDSPIYNNYNQ